MTEDKNEELLAKRRERMVEGQIISRGIKDERVIRAMRKIPRHLFVPADMIDYAYNDEPVPIGEGQTISQPYIVAYMTEALNLKESDRVLEIGTGSGYQSAVLAEIVKEVYTVEIIASLSHRAQELLTRLGYKNIYYKIIEINKEKNSFKFTFNEKPNKILFNPLSNIPINLSNYYAFNNIIDEFHNLIIIYGTARQIEANHTIALRYQIVLADAYTEILPPVKKDSEVNSELAYNNDLIILGHPSDNSFLNKIINKIPVSFKHNMFIYNNRTYAEPDDGLILTLPNPFNPKRIMYLIIANSALQLYKMTSKFYRGPNYAIYKSDKIIEEGYTTLPAIYQE